jgi:hypothetical protein
MTDDALDRMLGRRTVRRSLDAVVERLEHLERSVAVRVTVRERDER